jgi:hypothetical protein
VPPCDAVGVVLIADARLCPHCCYAVRCSPRTCCLWAAAPPRRHGKSLMGEPETAEPVVNSPAVDSAAAQNLVKDDVDGIG